jgi:D-aminopeptidase
MRVTLQKAGRMRGVDGAARGARIVLSGLLMASSLMAGERARDMGIPLEGTPGMLDAITDVAGVEVGHTTLISGQSVRTGVTAIWPRGKGSTDPAFGGWFSLNGNGEMDR